MPDVQRQSPGEYIKADEANAGRMGARLMAIVARAIEAGLSGRRRMRWRRALEAQANMAPDAPSRGTLGKQRTGASCPTV